MEKLTLNVEKVMRILGTRSQADLARELGVSRQVLNNWLTRRSVQAAPRIAKVLRVDARDLIQ